MPVPTFIHLATHNVIKLEKQSPACYTSFHYTAQDYIRPLYF